MGHGKYIAPQAIETKLKESELISQCIVFGENHKYASAIIIPDFAALGYEAESERLSFASKTDFSDAETPVGFEGVYTRGTTRVRWTISAGADARAWDACLGRPREVTREALDKAAAEELFAPGCDFNTTLFLDGDIPHMGYLRLESGTLDDVWEIIQTLVR